MISVIIPVYNEPDSINKLINKLLFLLHDKPSEIIIVDGHVEQTTLSLIKSNDVIKVASKKGRANQMNCGAEKAKGNILFFLHADSILSDNVFDDIFFIVFKGYRVGAFSLAIDSDNWWLKYVVSKLTTLRSKITRVPYGDQGIFILNDLFQLLGGFANISLMEDVDLMNRLKVLKEPVFISDTAIKTSARKWFDDGVFLRSLKNRCLIILYMMGVSPDELARRYYKK